MPYFLSPIGNDQQNDANGNPLVGGKVYTYLAGTSTPATTYTDNTGSTPQANPIILNSLGLPSSPIWLTGGITYKFVIKDSADVTIFTIDNVTGINDSTLTVSDWTLLNQTPTYISATSFSVPGDQTGLLEVGRRIKTSNTGGTAYSTITASVYSSVTTVTVVNDSTTLDSGLATVSYGIVSAVNPSLPSSEITRTTMGIYQNTVRSDVASATTVVLPTTTRAIRITGTTTITGFTVAAGLQYFVTFSGALTLTNNSWIVTNTSANITTAAGDTCIIRATAANTVEILSYSAAAPLVLRSHISGFGMTYATTSTTIAAGQCADSTNTVYMALTSSLQKLRTAWAVGSGSGGLDTGTYATNTWYYWYIIRRPDTGVVDAIFSLSSSAPTLPSGYTQYRYIGATYMGASVWTPFKQFGDYFQWASPVLDYNAAGSTTASLLTCSVPRGRKMWARFNIQTGASTTPAMVYLSDPDNTDLAPSSTVAPLADVFSGSGSSLNGNRTDCWTNTSGQIRHREGDTTTFYLATLGWMDLRGKDL